MNTLNHTLRWARCHAASRQSSQHRHRCARRSGGRCNAGRAESQKRSAAPTAVCTANCRHQVRRTRAPRIAHDQQPRPRGVGRRMDGQVGERYMAQGKATSKNPVTAARPPKPTTAPSTTSAPAAGPAKNSRPANKKPTNVRSMRFRPTASCSIRPSKPCAFPSKANRSRPICDCPNPRNRCRWCSASTASIRARKT